MTAPGKGWAIDLMSLWVVAELYHAADELETRGLELAACIVRDRGYRMCCEWLGIEIEGGEKK